MSQKLEAQVRVIREALIALGERLLEIEETYEQLPADVKAEVTRPVAEAGEVTHITDKEGRTLGRIVARQNEAVILPLETLKIKAGDPAITRFLIPRILNPLKEKHGIEYAIGEGDDLLKEIRLRGSGVRGNVDELKSPLAWAFERASARPVAASDLFPNELAEMLEFEDADRWTLIRPRRYLGSKNFARIATIVRDAKGEYISAGKEGHFRIPR